MKKSVAVLFLILLPFSLAATPYNSSSGYHPLQQVATDQTGITSVDADHNGIIDQADTATAIGDTTTVGNGLGNAILSLKGATTLWSAIDFYSGNTAYWGVGRNANDNKFYIDRSGVGRVFTIDPTTLNVGIGTSSPSGQLNVHKATGQVNQYLTSGDNGGAIIRMERYNSDGNYFTLETGAANRDTLEINPSSGTGLVMKTDGSVGIGTTSPTSVSKLTIDGTGANIRVRDSAATRYRSDWGFIGGSGAGFLINSYDDAGGVYLPFQLNANPLVLGLSGNVGIGTTDPSAAKLVVNGNVRVIPQSAAWAEGIQFYMPSTSTWGGLRWSRGRGNYDGNWYVGYTALDSTDDLVFGANSGGAQVDNILRLTKSGNVGIGTSSPQDKLFVSGSNVAGVDVLNNDGNDRPGLTVKGSYPEINIVSSQFDNSNHGPTLRFVGYKDGNRNSWRHWVIGTGGDATFLDFGYSGNSQTNPHMGIANYDRAWGGSSGDTFMRITSTGNVGIGKLVPSQKLDVNGGIGIAEGAFIGPASFGHNSGHDNTISFGQSGGSFGGVSVVNYFDGSYNNQFVTFSTHHGGVSAAERMRIDRDGNVGIGTTSPISKLDVQGNLVYGSGSGGWMDMRAFGQGGLRDGPGGRPFLVMDWDGTNGNKAYLQSPEGASSVMVTQLKGVQITGNVGIGTSNPMTKLDIRNSGNFAEMFIGNGQGVGNSLAIGWDPSNGAYGFIRNWGEDSGGIYLNNNNVGIGTSNPGYKLEVIGETVVRGDIYCQSCGNWLSTLFSSKAGTSGYYPSISAGYANSAGTINGIQLHGVYGGSTAGQYYHLGSWGGNGWGPDVLVERARYADSAGSVSIGQNGCYVTDRTEDQWQICAPGYYVAGEMCYKGGQSWCQWTYLYCCAP